MAVRGKTELEWHTWPRGWLVPLAASQRWAGWMGQKKGEGKLSNSDGQIPLGLQENIAGVRAT